MLVLFVQRSCWAVGAGGGTGAESPFRKLRKVDFGPNQAVSSNPPTAIDHPRS